MLLYKYIDENVVKVLKNLVIKVNDPENFNDPFDCKPGIKPFTTMSEKRRYLNHATIIDYYYKKIALKEGIHSKKEFKKKWQERKFAILKVLDDIHEHARKAWDLIPHGEYLFLLCMSEAINNPYDEILMWSHYTDGHKGARIGIETDFFITPINEKAKVGYSQDRLSFHVKDINLDPDKVRLVTMSSIYTKNMSWKYENEYRLLFDARLCKKMEDIHYVDIKPEAISEIVMGCNMPPELQKTILDILGAEKFNHVKKKKAVVDYDHYQLRYIDI